MPRSLPSKVQRLPDNQIVDPRELKVGQQFIHEGLVWTVKEVTADGVDCMADPTRFIYGACLGGQNPVCSARIQVRPNGDFLAFAAIEKSGSYLFSAGGFNHSPRHHSLGANHAKWFPALGYPLHRHFLAFAHAAQQTQID